MESPLFKEIMSSFPTGVSVVTALDGEGKPRGITCSAVCSVSLEPAMLLVCIGKGSGTLPVLRARGSFVVNFLAENGGEVAYACASRTADKFAGLAWRPSERAHGAPILAEHAVAYAECTVHELVDAGDHLVVIAKVEDGAAFEARHPLVHARGRLAQLNKAAAQAA